MEPVVVEPGGGEPVSRKLSVLAETDPVVVTEMLYVPGDTGPDPHIHKEHADCFWIVAGRVVFEVGREAQRLEMPAGSFVGVPPEIVHTFRNEGPQDARILNFHAPGCGFARYVRALVAGDDTTWFDSHDPPADGGPPATAALVVPPGDGERDEDPDAAVVWKARDGHLSVCEQVLPAGGDDAASDGLYVLEGTLAVAWSGGKTEAATGTFVLPARGARLAIVNPGTRPVRVLRVQPAG